MPHKRKFVESLAKGLESRKDSGLLRTLQINSGLDFTSNDYLGYSQCSQLKLAVQQAVAEFGVGCGASRLLRGNHSFIETTETQGVLASRLNTWKSIRTPSSSATVTCRRDYASILSYLRL